MKLDPVTIEILWNRLLAIVDEADVIATKTAFSPIIRDVHDYSCSLFDNKGRMIVQGTYTTPGQVGSMIRCIKTIINKGLINLKEIKPGDVFILNDPWLLTGHLLDIMTLTPVFYHSKLVAFGATLFHHMDIGGTIGAGNKEIYEEGLRLPLVKLYEEGVLNQDVFDIVHANIRMADMIMGDIKAQVAANDLVVNRLRELLDELKWEDFNDLADEIFSRSESSIRAEIEKFPEGIYRGEGYIERPDSDEPIIIKLAIEIKGSNVHADFEGSSTQIDIGINCTYNIVYSHYVYAIKTLIDPLIPNNDGTLRCMTMSAPEGSIVNCKFPAATCGRTAIALLMECIIYKILSQAIPERVIAQSSAAWWYSTFHGTTREGSEFMITLGISGGMGARFSKDGISCLSFPANVKTNSIEMFEADTPLLFRKKEFICDSGGPGKFRGGLGQEVVIVVPKDEYGPVEPVVESLIGGRMKYPASGILGGCSGAVGERYINNKRARWGKQYLLSPGDIVTYKIGGGGGFGSPIERDPSLVFNDVRNGYVSIGSALRDYEVVIDEKNMTINGK